MPGPDNWTPFRDRLDFETGDFLFRRNQMSAPDSNELLDLWAASLVPHDDSPPFADNKDVHNTIDAIPLGDVPWQSFTTSYSGTRPATNAPPWMDTEYEVWWRDPHAVVQNMLSNPDFDGEIDYTPYQEYDSNDERRLCDFFSGDWAWKQAVSAPKLVPVNIIGVLIRLCLVRMKSPRILRHMDLLSSQSS